MRGKCAYAPASTVSQLKEARIAVTPGIYVIAPDTYGQTGKVLARFENASEIEALSKRVNELGWHVQFNIDAQQMVAIQDLLDRLPATIVIDHMGHMPQPAGIDDPAFGIVRKLIDKGRTWVKLSVTYDSSKIGPPTYADVNKVGAAYVQAANAEDADAITA